MTGEVVCNICGKDLSENDVEYHYSRQHEIAPMGIPKEILVQALRSAYRTCGELKEAAGVKS